MSAPSDRELRFTCNLWGAGCLLAACPFLLAAVSIFLPPRDGLPLTWPAALPRLGCLAAAGASVWAGVKLLGRTYIVASAFSLDVLPLWRPQRRMRAIPWGAMASADLAHGVLKIIRRDGAAERVSLCRMRARQRELLGTLVERRLRRADSREGGGALHCRDADQT